MILPKFIFQTYITHKISDYKIDKYYLSHSKNQVKTI